MSKTITHIVTKKQLVPELRFKGFDEEWKIKQLGDVSKFLDGKRKPIKSEDRSKMKGEYPYYGASGIIDYVNSYIFDQELILLGEDGENIISRNLPLAFRVSGKCWINNHAHVIVPNLDTNIDFLTHSLEKINYVVYNTGTAQPKLNQEVCRSIPSWYPSLPEQQKIASFLSAVDEKIQQLTHKKELLEQYKKGVMQQLFCGKLRFKDESGKENANWEEKRLGDILELQHGYQFRTSDFTKEGLAIIKISNVIGNNLYLQDLSFINSNRLKEFSRFEISKGDILMSLTGNIGRVIEVESVPFKMIQNYRVGKFVPYDSNYLSKKFTKHLLMSDVVFGRFGQLSNQSAQANFGKQDMDKILVSIPLLSEQLKIANFLSNIDSKIESTSQQITQTQTFKKGLLQKMFV